MLWCVTKSRFTARHTHEHVRELMTRGYVDDSLLASLGSGVSFARLEPRQ